VDRVIVGTAAPSDIAAGARRPSIVAIIPLYNGARWIEQSIRSVLAQTLLPDEFIVVDDGSTDEGPDIVRRIAADIPFVKLLGKRNGGQSSARNFGVAHSNSDLIALLDQDDAWYSSHLEELVKPFMERQPIPLGWVYSNLDECDETCGLINRNFLHRLPSQHPKLSLFRCLSEDMFVLPSAALISRQAFEAVGAFDEQLCGYEDDDLFLRLFRAGYANVFVDKALSAWRIYPGSTSFTTRMAQSRMIYAKKLFATFPDEHKANRFYCRDLIAPRFLKNLAWTIHFAIQIDNPEFYRQTVQDFSIVLPRCRFRHRALFRIALVFLRSYSATKLAYKTGALALGARMLRSAW
jgi:glycosyltransferase involved in cell wall biosynthesis